MGLGQTIRVMAESMAEKKDNKGGKESTEGFVVTSTDRVDHLHSRVAPNEAQLKTYLKELKEFKPRAQGLFNSVQSVLSANSPLPTDNTTAASPGAPASLGTVVGTNPISRLDTTVILPIERWLAEYHTLKTDRLPVMEKTRLELDSRRRQELELIDEVQTLRTQELPTDASKLDKHNRKFEEKAHLLAHKQTKMHAVNKTFIDQEAAVYQHLQALMADAELIPEYMAEGLTYFKDMFERALGSFPHGSRTIPATLALERSNHNELWKDANTPNVPIPVLPEPVPATTMATSPHTIPFSQAHTPAAADVASDNHGALRDITKDRPFVETGVQQPYHTSVPPTRQFEVEAPHHENATALPFRDQPAFVNQQASSTAYPPHATSTSTPIPQYGQSQGEQYGATPTPQYGQSQGEQYGAPSSLGGLPRTGQMEMGQHGGGSPASHA